MRLLKYRKYLNDSLSNTECRELDILSDRGRGGGVLRRAIFGI
jgi:hypothetical protein